MNTPKPTGYEHLSEVALKHDIKAQQKQIPQLQRNVVLMRRELKRRARKVVA